MYIITYTREKLSIHESFLLLSSSNAQLTGRPVSGFTLQPLRESLESCIRPLISFGQLEHYDWK